MMGTCICTGTHYLDAVLKQESWHGEALFFIKRFTENDDLLKEENPPFFTARQKSRVLVRDQERVLQEQLTLRNDFTLEGGAKEEERRTLHSKSRHRKFCFLSCSQGITHFSSINLKSLTFSLIIVSS